MNKETLKNISKAAEKTVEALQRTGITKQQIKDALGLPEDYIKQMVKDCQKANDKPTEGNK